MSAGQKREKECLTIRKQCTEAKSHVSANVIGIVVILNLIGNLSVLWIPTCVGMTVGFD
jgi:hypothetical protein